MNGPKKILFVVDTLAQHGAERYLYEILKSIDRTKFECSVLCTYPLTDRNNFYQPLITELGIEILSFEFGELYPYIKSPLKRKILNSIAYRWLNLTKGMDEINKRSQLRLLARIKGFDLVSILKIETFNRFSDVFVRIPNLVIHLLSWGIQYLENPYRNLPDHAYQFVTMIDSQEDHVNKTDFKNIINPNFSFFGFPLLLELNDRKNNYIASAENPIVGVFSRMNFDQPTMMFLYAFQLLLKRVPTAKLYFYGKAINDQFQQFYAQTANILGISDALVFKGHVPDLKKSIQEDEITMGWMNVGNSTLGYSSIEISSYGLPVTFFNIDKHDPSKIDSRLSVFNDLEDFADHSAQVLTDKTKLEEESAKLYDFIQTEHDSKNIIQKLEQHYLSIIADTE